MRELRVQPIKNGTVIDHIPSGMALKVLKILGISDNVASTVTVAMHVASSKMKWKDIVKVEDRELNPREVDKICLIAPSATVNVVRNYNVAEKRRVSLPEKAVGILKCGNPNCITNQRERAGGDCLPGQQQGPLGSEVQILRSHNRGCRVVHLVSPPQLAADWLCRSDRSLNLPDSAIWPQGW